MERKSCSFELKDLSKDKRTAIIAHAVYGNIDLVGDISTKGMFKSSWERKDAVDFLFNHYEEEIPGQVVRTFEDDARAYTEVKFGNWKLGDDILEMLDAGVIRGASFGYEVEKKHYKKIGDKNIRVLTQVKHIETSILTKRPANPLAGVIAYTKADGDVMGEFKAHIERLESFCRNANASDATIIDLQREIKQSREILSRYDTASTPLITDGDASVNDNGFKRKLLLLQQQLAAQTI